MDNRALFHATMRGENGSQLLHVEQGFNVDYERWVADGLPPDVANVANAELTPGQNLYDHADVSGYLYCNPWHWKQICVPAFEEEVLSEREGRRISRTRTGSTIEERTDARPGSPTGSPPHEIDFAVRDRRSYEENRFRFVGNTALRNDQQWLDANAGAVSAQRDYLVSLWVYGPFAYLREILGVENAMVLPYEDRGLAQLMLDDYFATVTASVAPTLRACRPDLSFVWEDCCGSTGPFIAPDVFQQLFAPWYRAFKEFVTAHGTPWIVMDTDGNPSGLARAWYEAGVDCMQPWEVNSSDLLRFAADHPGLAVMGGIYKHMFEPTHPSQVGRFATSRVTEAIDQELDRVVRPLRARGRYLAALDHWAFWGTTYEGYMHYSRRLRDHGKANHVTRNLVSPGRG